VIHACATALPGVIAMACSFAGMFIGQALRTRVPADAFRYWFLIAMIFLGLYIAGAAVIRSSPETARCECRDK
jgi:uncharacterized protein